MRDSILLSIFFFIYSFSVAQCDFSSNGIGTFEGSAYNDWSYLNTAGGAALGVFSSEPTIVHSGSSSLKIDVTTAHSWGVRMYNQCNNSLVSGNFYTVSFWVYGGNGNLVKVGLQHHDAGTTVISEKLVDLTSNGWAHYSVVFESDGNYTKGKVKFTFPNTGIFYLDDITLTESIPGASKTVAPNDPKIQYNGVVSNTKTPSKATFYRFPESYATSSTNGVNPWVAYTTANRSAASAGISIEFKTNSKIITAKFVENTIHTGGLTTLSFAVYKNGELYNVFYDNTDNVEFSFNDPTGAINHWRITMPTFAQVEFLGLEIDQNSDLETLPTDSRPVYVAIGNSITHGVGQTKYSTHLTYPWQVADSLNYQLYNWGIGGSKINELVFDNFAAAGIIPDVVSVLWGYNDFNCANNCNTDEYIINKTMVYYKNLMTNLTAAFPNAIIVGILPTFSNTSDYTSVRSLDYLRTAQQDVITTLQSSHSNIRFFNGNDVTNASSLSDDVHLNDAGATEVANRLIEELLKTSANTLSEIDTLVLRSEYEQVGDNLIDLNTSSEGSVSYMITNGNSSGHYSIDPLTGVLSINKVIADVATVVHWDSLTIVAGTTTFKVNIADAYDHFVVTNPSYNVIESPNTIVQSGDYSAYNNPWGVGTAVNGEDFRMATLVHSDNPDSTVFLWDVPSKAESFGGSSVWCYNNLFWGERYGLTSGNTNFPVKVGDIDVLNLNFNFEKLFGTDDYKIALNQFFTSENSIVPFSSNQGDFFMVFDQVGTYVPTYNDLLGDSLIGGHTYAIMHDSTGTMEGKPLGYQFRRAIIKNNGTFSSGQVDLKAMYNTFKNSGFLSDELHFPNIQFGIEITNGWGAVRVNKFEINHVPIGTYTITYNLDNGTASNPTTYKTESATIILTDAAKSGYTFDGWFSDASYTHQVTEIKKGSTGDITLFAKFSPMITGNSSKDLETFSFYPNPCIEYIQFSVDVSILEIVNSAGTVVSRITSNRDKYNVANLKAGLYLFKITTIRGDIHTGKFRRE